MCPLTKRRAISRHRHYSKVRYSSQDALEILRNHNLIKVNQDPNDGESEASEIVGLGYLESFERRGHRY